MYEIFQSKQTCHARQINVDKPSLCKQEEINPINIASPTTASDVYLLQDKLHEIFDFVQENEQVRCKLEIALGNDGHAESNVI